MDGSVPVEIFIDTLPYNPSMDLSTGLHSVEARAMDAAGNTAFIEIVIVLSNVPFFTPKVEATILECLPSSLFESLEVLLSSEDFDVATILVESTFLWILNLKGQLGA